jgi:hypothetical protein
MSMFITVVPALRITGRRAKEFVVACRALGPVVVVAWHRHGAVLELAPSGLIATGEFLAATALVDDIAQCGDSTRLLCDDFRRALVPLRLAATDVPGGE